MEPGVYIFCVTWTGGGTSKCCAAWMAPCMHPEAEAGTMQVVDVMDACSGSSQWFVENLASTASNHCRSSCVSAATSFQNAASPSPATSLSPASPSLAVSPSPTTLPSPAAFPSPTALPSPAVLPSPANVAVTETQGEAQAAF